MKALQCCRAMHMHAYTPDVMYTCLGELLGEATLLASLFGGGDCTLCAISLSLSFSLARSLSLTHTSDIRDLVPSVVVVPRERREGTGS